MKNHHLTRRDLLRSSAATMYGIAGAALLAACGGTTAATSSGTAATTTISPALAATTAVLSSTSSSAAQTTASASAAPTTSSATVTQTTTAAASATTTAAPTTAAAAAAAVNGGNVTLQVMDFALTTPEAQARWAKVKAAFLQKYPDVKITEDFTNDFSTKLPVLVASGTPPDISPLRRQAEFPELAPYGAVIDLSPYMARSKVLLKADFYPAALTMQSIAGKLYALPTTQNPFGLYYNKDLFAAQGVNPPDSSWDYQDWQDAAIKLNKYQDGTWTRIGGMMPSWWVIHYAGNHSQAMWQGGPTEPGVCTRVNYDQPKSIQAYQWYQEMICKNHLSPTDDQANKLSPKGYEGLFSGGTAAMMFSFDERGYFTDTVKGNFKWDWALPPLGDKKQPRVVTTIGGGMALYTLSKVKDTGWNYLEFTQAPAFLLESVKANGARSVYSNQRVQEAPEYQASSIPPTDKKVLVDAINSGQFFPEPAWELRGLKITAPTLPKGTPDPSSCGADAPTLLHTLADAYNGALKAKGVSICG